MMKPMPPRNAEKPWPMPSEVSRSARVDMSVRLEESGGRHKGKARPGMSSKITGHSTNFRQDRRGNDGALRDRESSEGYRKNAPRHYRPAESRSLPSAPLVEATAGLASERHSGRSLRFPDSWDFLAESDDSNVILLGWIS